VSARPALSPYRRWGLAVVLTALSAIGCALAVRSASALAARLEMPTGAAQWIWVAREWRDLTPAAFYAVHDFAVEAPPARARLLAMADEEYVLTLNGRAVGTGRWRPGGGLDVYEVGSLLQPGLNRLIAELRSDSGSGGFLASLDDPATGRQLARTDESWRIVRRHQLGLVRGWLPLAGPGAVESDPAFCLGYPPTGRWGRPAAGRAKPRLDDLLRGRPLPAVSVRPVRFATRVPERPQPPQVLFDWGREVVGYLDLAVQRSDRLGMALLYTGLTPPDPLAGPPASSILVLPGKDRWLDVQPRRFRYALVVGAPGPRGARVLPVDESVLGRFPPPRGTAPVRGVLGVAPPPLRTPVEDEVWRELESIPGVAGRKKP
jgi:hypothetical protein